MFHRKGFVQRKRPREGDEVAGIDEGDRDKGLIKRTSDGNEVMGNIVSDSEISEAKESGSDEGRVSGANDSECFCDEVGNNRERKLANNAVVARAEEMSETGSKKGDKAVTGVGGGIKEDGESLRGEDGDSVMEEGSIGGGLTEGSGPVPDKGPVGGNNMEIATESGISGGDNEKFDDISASWDELFTDGNTWGIGGEKSDYITALNVEIERDKIGASDRGIEGEISCSGLGTDVGTGEVSRDRDEGPSRIDGASASVFNVLGDLNEPPPLNTHHRLLILL